MKLSKAVKSGLKKKLSSLALGISSKPVSIIEIPLIENEIGYTSENGGIHLAFESPWFNGLNEVNTVMFIKGVFAHELMHQLATDFKAAKNLTSSMNRFESEIFMTIANVMEDPAIEHLAPRYFGGHLLRALRFSIAHIYKKSPAIDTRQSPFSQFLQAYIQYGDGGFLKGDFSSDEAKEAFINALPYFDKAITCTDKAKRVAYAHQVFKLTEPLWRPEVDDMEMAEKLMQELSSLMGDNGKGTKGSSKGSSELPTEDEDEGDELMSTKEMRRKATKRKLSEEKSKEKSEAQSKDSSENKPDKNSGESGDSSESADKSSEEGKEDKEKGEQSSSSDSSGTKDENGEDDSSSSSSSDSKKDNSSDNDGDKSDDTPKNEESENYTDKNSSIELSPSEATITPPESGDTLEGVGEISDEEFEMTDEDIKEVKDNIDSFNREATSEKYADKELDEIDLNVEGMDVNYKGANCKNHLVKYSATPVGIREYERLVAPMRGDIKLLTNSLKRIFKNDTEQKEHRATGRINIKRVSEGKMTPRLFDRRKAPADKSNLCVMLLIDESGSMGGSKEYCARQAAIGLAETFGALKIPTAIMGFTADTGGYDVVQYHYLHWKNTLSDRYKLMQIKARANNFDGYSIRYATKMLAKRKEQHKLFIILSDGQPACRYYYGATSGVKDTTKAIQEAAKVADVIGVGIGLYDDSVLYSMYKEHFVSIKDVTQLYHQLSGVIKKKIKGWE